MAEGSKGSGCAKDGSLISLLMGLAEDSALTITVSRFFGLKRLVLEGWRLV